MATRRHTLLEPGHEAEWTRLDAEKRRFLTPPGDTPTGELLRRGQRLSAQAAALLRAVERANRPRDQNDLLGLEEIHGALPAEPIPGLDG